MNTEKIYIVGFTPVSIFKGSSGGVLTSFPQKRENVIIRDSTDVFGVLSTLQKEKDCIKDIKIYESYLNPVPLDLNKFLEEHKNDEV